MLYIMIITYGISEKNVCKIKNKNFTEFAVSYEIFLRISNSKVDDHFIFKSHLSSSRAIANNTVDLKYDKNIKLFIIFSRMCCA